MRSGAWPRSYSLAVVLIIAFVFGALSYVPFVASVIFYPPGSLISTSGYLNRSPVGDGLQMAYELVLLEIGYLIGKKVAFESDYLCLLPLAYFGAVIGYIVGLPGLETTTISGGILLFQTNLLNSAHIQSAFFNSATLMGVLISGIALSSVFQRRGSTTAMPGDEGEPTDATLLIAIFAMAAVIALLAYVLPSTFFLAFSDIAGSSAATNGFLYTFSTDSIVIANPLLLFVYLYFVGNDVNVLHDASKVMVTLFVAVLVGALAGNPVGSYATVYVSSGIGVFPNYLTNTATLATFLTAAVDVSFAGMFLGFAAISVSATRRIAKTGRVLLPQVAET